MFHGLEISKGSSLSFTSIVRKFDYIQNTCHVSVPRSHTNMPVNAGTLRTLKHLFRFSNHHRHINKSFVRALSTYKHVEFLKEFNNQNIRSDSIRKYGEWAPNVVRSPYPIFEIPDQLIHELVWSKIDNWKDLTAVVCGLTGRDYKYSQLRTLCRRLATSLLKAGLKPGEVVALVLPNMPEFLVSSLGVLEAGLVLSPINPAYTPDEIAYQLRNSSAVAVITFPDKLEAVIEAKDLLIKENTEFSNLRVICTPDVLGNEKDLPSGVEKFSNMIEDDASESSSPSLETRRRSPTDLAFLPYSSGTTGVPKGVCLTHNNLMAGVLNIQHGKSIQETSNGKQDIVPFILPGFHIYGFSVIMASTLLRGGKLITLPRFEENSFLQIMTDYKPTVLFVAPPLMIYLGASPKVTMAHLESVRLILSGAAPCGHSDIERCVSKSPSSIQYKQGYGLTETSPAVCLMANNVPKYSSVGQPVPNTQVKVADLQTGQALGPNEEGEICVKGPQVMKGYLNNEKANAESFDSEGWFRTGDIGYYDNDKDFYITDRLKELIKVKGFQVAPAELEALLRSHPQIEDAGVIGVPDPLKGEVPIGFVKPAPGASPLAEDLKTFLSQKVAKFKQIDTFVFVEAIPKSASGKILRKTLKENYLESVNLNNYLKEKQN